MRSTPSTDAARERSQAPRPPGPPLRRAKGKPPATTSRRPPGGPPARCPSPESLPTAGLWLSWPHEIDPLQQRERHDMPGAQPAPDPIVDDRAARRWARADGLAIALKCQRDHYQIVISAAGVA